jgi:glucose-6-phosphate 1-dehydrogenase
MEPFNPDMPPCVLVIFGASGDLTWRKLVPALYSLVHNDLLPEHLQILGVARTEYSDQEFRQHLYEGVVEYGRIKPEKWEAFARRLFYMMGSYDQPETFRRLAQRLAEFDQKSRTRGNRLYYLAIPPFLYPTVIRELGENGLNHSDEGWVRVIIEKPFGHDLESARGLNEQIHTYFQEEQIYRIDHYLGKETVQNILAFRFANFIFQEIWGRNYVDHVQISAIEQVGVGHRGGYYDQAGVVRDMIQNHLLQLLALTAMEPPISLDDEKLRDEKVKVLQSIRPLEMADTAWGQYQGYREEPEVDPDSKTPTFVALKFQIDNWRWQGVPFYLRAGKSLKRKNTEITLLFKQVPHLIYHENYSPVSNELSICIQPDEGMHLRFELKIPGAQMRTSPVAMDFHYGDVFGDQALPDAYERLIMDAIEGDKSLFSRNDEIERAWELVTPLLDQWDNMEDPPLEIYERGMPNPPASDRLLARDSRNWVVCCHDLEEDTGWRYRQAIDQPGSEP